VPVHGEPATVTGGVVNSHPPTEPCSRPGVRHGPVFDGVHRSPARAALAPEVGAPVHPGVLAGTHTELAADVEALIDRHRGHARTAHAIESTSRCMRERQTPPPVSTRHK